LCLDEYVGRESAVRVIDKFIDGADLEGLGFKNAVPKEVGRNPYDPAYLAKLLVYGYEHGERSSRKLEGLTHVNIEVMWLMDELKPDFKTIADFRKDNLAPLAGLLSEYNAFLDYSGLFGKKLVAIDGTKVKASNNKKNNYSRKKLARNIEYNEKRVKEYMAALAEADDMDCACEATKKIQEYERRVEKAKGQLRVLEESGGNELSTVDPDARLMGNNRSGVDMAYNVQVAVDGKAHMAAAFDVTQNPADHGQLGNMTEKTQEAFRKKGITVLADKGYYGSEDIEKAEALGAVPIVARQLKPGEKAGKRFSLDKFVYDKDKDEYICPEGNQLPAHSKSKTKDRVFFDKEACKACPASGECLGKDKYRRIVRRPQNDVLDRAGIRLAENKELYKQRQQIVEHVFGTMKRTMNGGYFLLRGKEKVKAEAALMLLGYNIKRTMGAMGFERTMGMLAEWEAFLRDRAVFAVGSARRFFAAFGFSVNRCVAIRTI
jgi:transposase